MQGDDRLLRFQPSRGVEGRPLKGELVGQIVPVVPESFTFFPPLLHQLCARQMQLVLTRLNRCQFRGSGVAFAVTGHGLQHLCTALGELVDEPLRDALNLEPLFLGREGNGQPLDQLIGEFGAVERARRHLVDESRAADYRACRPVRAYADVDEEGMGVKLRVVGAAGPVLKHRYDEADLLQLLPALATPGIARLLLQVGKRGLDRLVMRRTDVLLPTFGRDGPQSRDALGRGEAEIPARLPVSCPGVLHQ